LAAIVTRSQSRRTQRLTKIPLIEDGTVRFAAARVQMEGQVIGPRGSKGEHCSLLNHPIACRVRWYEAFEMLPPAMMGRDPGVNQNILGYCPNTPQPERTPCLRSWPDRVGHSGCLDPGAESDSESILRSL